MDKAYDIIIVGAGPAGIFAAYELSLKAPDKKVLLVDKGRAILKRHCPILEKKRTKCPEHDNGAFGCHQSCSITSGFGGAGAYSDGKFNVTSAFGGWMTSYISDETVASLIEYVDAINLKHGASETITDPDTAQVRAIEKQGLAVGLKLLKAKVRHLGTEENLEILKRIYTYLKAKVTMQFETPINDIIVKDGMVKGIVLDEDTDTVINAEHVALMPGRDGAEWLENLCENHGIKRSVNHVDIGVRVETSNEIMEEINEHLYEGKFVYHASVGTMVRTFCSNPSGHVVIENHGGTMLANGHAYYDENLGSPNTNFAILVSHAFEAPFKRPNDFARGVARLANMLSNGSVIVQKYGDFKKGRRTTQKRLDEGFVRPTLEEAFPGDLGLVLPYNTFISIIEMIEALDKVTPGIASGHTLFYGVEAKFYSARPKIDDTFESTIKNLYFGGDGAGITRGLAQASASGVHIARSIITKENTNG